MKRNTQTLLLVLLESQTTTNYIFFKCNGRHDERRRVSIWTCGVVVPNHNEDDFIVILNCTILLLYVVLNICNESLNVSLGYYL